MAKRAPFSAPATIRRVAARRTFRSARGRPVVLTIGVPQRVPGSDWGCAVQVTGLSSWWRRPRYIFGIDGLQALHLAMKFASTVLDAMKPPLTWLDEPGELGLPKFLPYLPKRLQDKLEAHAEREALKYWTQFERRHKAKAARKTPAKRRVLASRTS